MQRVLVTGATGLAGSHVLERLAATPRLEVIAACRGGSRLDPGFGARVRSGDLRGRAYLDTLFDGVDTCASAPPGLRCSGTASCHGSCFSSRPSPCSMPRGPQAYAASSTPARPARRHRSAPRMR